MDSLVKSLFSNSALYGETDALLMREYKRRSALWAEFLGLNSKWPYLDIAQALVDRGEARYDQALLEKRLTDLEEVSRKAWPKRLGKLIVSWESLSEREPVNLPDPFLPLKLVYQRGCNFFGPQGSTVEFAGGGTIHLGPAPNGDLSKVIDHGPWISDEEIADLQKEVTV